MTPTDLIEAAARAVYEATGGLDEHGPWDDQLAVLKSAYMTEAEAVFASLPVPLSRLAHLASGEAWIAPHELTPAMREAVADAERVCGAVTIHADCDDIEGGPRRGVWEILRDSHLSGVTPEEMESSKDAE